MTHQDLMDVAYARWQNNKQWTKDDFFDSLDARERFAVFTGNLNYQVENGGWSQWKFNRYATDEVVAYLRRNLPKVGPNGVAVAKLMDEFLAQECDDEDEVQEDEDRLCSAYYAINTAFMAECEKFLREWK